jgi:hypothetical protein
MSDSPETLDHEPATKGRDYGSIRATVIKLFIASLLVGFVMHWLDITPVGILHALTNNFEELFSSLINVVSWVLEFVLIGAVIVVPIWLLMRIFGGRKGG